MTQRIALDSQQHQHYKLQEDKLFSHTKLAHILPLEVNEFAAAAAYFPIVFVKDSNTGQFRACVMTGIKPGQNLYWHQAGWQAGYTPQALRNYPLLAVQPDTTSGDYVIVVDTQSSLFNPQSGHSLFAAGQATEYLQQRAGAAIAQAKSVLLTQQFIQLLLELKLLVARTLTLTPQGAEAYDLTGLYLIDEQRLAELTDQQWLSLRQNNSLLAVHAVLMSMNQVSALIQRSVL